MRQAGVLAACGLVSLEKMIPRLEDDHDNAKYLALKLNELEGFFVDMEKVQINMAFCKIDEKEFDHKDFQAKLLNAGIKINLPRGNQIRFVTNNDISREDIDYTIKTIRNIVNN